MPHATSRRGGRRWIRGSRRLKSQRLLEERGQKEKRERASEVKGTGRKVWGDQAGGEGYVQEEMHQQGV